jgi:hypothetical protein
MTCFSKDKRVPKNERIEEKYHKSQSKKKREEEWKIEFP